MGRMKDLHIDVINKENNKKVVEYSYLEEIKIIKGFFSGYYATVINKHGDTYEVKIMGLKTQKEIYVTPENSRKTGVIDWVIKRFI